MKNVIPKYVQVFKQIDIDIISESVKLIETYEKGGCQIDESYLKKNPNAKHKFMYVISKHNMVTGTKVKLNPDSSIGYWIYCGNCYVRKIEDKYEFGNYMIYDTKLRKITDSWDETKFKVNA
jgi:hypothetical protein